MRCIICAQMSGERPEAIAKAHEAAALLLKSEHDGLEPKPASTEYTSEYDAGLHHACGALDVAMGEICDCPAASNPPAGTGEAWHAKGDDALILASTHSWTVCACTHQYRHHKNNEGACDFCDCRATMAMHPHSYGFSGGINDSSHASGQVGAALTDCELDWLLGRIGSCRNGVFKFNPGSCSEAEIKAAILDAIAIGRRMEPIRKDREARKAGIAQAGAPCPNGFTGISRTETQRSRKMSRLSPLASALLASLEYELPENATQEDYDKFVRLQNELHRAHLDCGRPHEHVSIYLGAHELIALFKIEGAAEELETHVLGEYTQQRAAELRSRAAELRGEREGEL